MTNSTTKSDHQPTSDGELENEIYSLMRAIGRSFVQVLNAIMVRWSERDDITAGGRQIAGGQLDAWDVFHAVTAEAAVRYASRNGP